MCFLAPAGARAADPCDVSLFDQSPPGTLQAQLAPPGLTALSDLDTWPDQREAMVNVILNMTGTPVTALWMDRDTNTQVLYAGYFDGGVRDRLCRSYLGPAGHAQPGENSYVEVDGQKQEPVGVYHLPPSPDAPGDDTNPLVQFVIDRLIEWAGGKQEDHRLTVTVSQKGADPEVTVEATPGDGFAFALDTFPGGIDALTTQVRERKGEVSVGTPRDLGLVSADDSSSRFEWFAFRDYVRVTGIEGPLTFNSDVPADTASPLFLVNADGKTWLAGSLMLKGRG